MQEHVGEGGRPDVRPWPENVFPLLLLDDGDEFTKTFF